MNEVRLLTIGNVTVSFAWYDLWIGAYVDRKNKILYICLLPTLLVAIRFGTRFKSHREGAPSDRGDLSLTQIATSKTPRNDRKVVLKRALG